MSGPDWDSLGRAWWSHVRVLAGDNMQGRETGSPGYQRAAAYVAEQFQAAGLEPAGVDGYRQSVDFRVSQLDEPNSSLTLIRGGTAQPLQLRDDAQFAVSTGTVPDLEAEVVFVGYGLDVPEHQYSDLAGLDLNGKIAVYFRGGPSDLPGPIKAHYQSVEERLRSLRKAGVVGSVMMTNPKVPDLPWPRIATGLLLPRMELAEAMSDSPRPLPLAMAFNPDRLELLMAGSGHSASEIMQGLGGPGPLPRFPLAVKIRAHVAVRRSMARCTNVVGLLPGSDPTLRTEYVAGSAHLDHLGIGEPVNGKSLYGGAMDNASGVATLIQIARMMKESGQRPRRSMIFLAVTGEEKGLLGSEYFATHPSVAGPIVANLNMDMFLPLYPLKYLEIQGLGESSLGRDIRALGAEVGVRADAEYEPDRVLFIRSDQYNFVKKGVPALMLSVGYQKGSPEEETSKAWFRDRYHAPADDVEQPVDLVAAAQFTDLLGKLMLKVADAQQRPTWNEDSFFRRFVR
ncbi:MAG: M20/M25/M40 family metallo-hydrolase [Thermoplasmata archaeon]|nr:M20/M25/M40 family metallo-hydrolase [Thermoplasmata archaeon]